MLSEKAFHSVCLLCERLRERRTPTRKALAIIVKAGLTPELDEKKLLSWTLDKDQQSFLKLVSPISHNVCLPLSRERQCNCRCCRTT